MKGESNGRLVVVGLGPGLAEWITPAVQAILADTQDFVGYAAYLERLTGLTAHQRLHASDNRKELERARHALALAASGRKVTVVSGGDPGIFAMAAALFEAVELGPEAWRGLDIRVEPGITAMLAVSARIGAPLGHDFAVISLSDRLKPWSLVEKRLRLAARADFVLACYNPASKARPHQWRKAQAILASERASDVPVVFARAIGRLDEDIRVTSLFQAADLPVDMASLVIVGSLQTRIVERRNGGSWVYSPRCAPQR